MESFKSRPYSTESDLTRMQALRQRTRSPIYRNAYLKPIDLRTIFDDPAADAPPNTRLWEDTQGTLIGFAVLHLPWNNLEFELDPTWFHSAIEQEVVNWGLERLRTRARSGDAAMTLDAFIHADDTDRGALLERHGFTAGNQTLYLGRSLIDLLPPVDLPEGFILRPLAGEAEIDSYVSAHQEAFNTEHMTADRRLRLMHDPDFGYRPELDLVAVTQDGTIAAFCICSIKPLVAGVQSGNEGWVEIIGTRPAFRRRGLGRVLLTASLHRLHEHGATTAMLSTGSWNTGARHVYESAGFGTVDAGTWYGRVVKNKDL